jgi:biopolymer transport protein TolQ
MSNPLSFNLSIFNIFFSADMFGKFVILALFFTSVFCWAVVIYKILCFKSIRDNMNKFEDSFWRSSNLDDFQHSHVNNLDNPLAKIFRAGMKEYKDYVNIDNNDISGLKISLKERIFKSMDILRNRELELIESHLSFLATTGSVAPFVGLLGTVWGIMHSFGSIANSKNTSLAVVAPGISEALFATALGLFVAIPAVIFYNLLCRKSEVLSNKIDDFMFELQNMISRNIDNKGQVK